MYVCMYVCIYIYIYYIKHYSSYNFKHLISLVQYISKSHAFLCNINIIHSFMYLFIFVSVLLWLIF